MSNKRFTITKKLSLGSVAFRQPNATSHCNQIHGYELSAIITVGSTKLDHNNWVFDYGSFKDIKKDLSYFFDHKVCLAKGDPIIPLMKEIEKAGGATLRVFESGVGVERFAEFVALRVDSYIRNITDNRAYVVSVEIQEHQNNSSKYDNQDATDTSLNYGSSRDINVLDINRVAKGEDTILLAYPTGVSTPEQVNQSIEELQYIIPPVTGIPQMVSDLSHQEDLLDYIDLCKEQIASVKDKVKEEADIFKKKVYKSSEEIMGAMSSEVEDDTYVAEFDMTMAEYIKKGLLKDSNDFTFKADDLLSPEELSEKQCKRWEGVTEDEKLDFEIEIGDDEESLDQIKDQMIEEVNQAWDSILDKDGCRDDVLENIVGLFEALTIIVKNNN